MAGPLKSSAASASSPTNRHNNRTQYNSPRKQQQQQPAAAAVGGGGGSASSSSNSTPVATTPTRYRILLIALACLGSGLCGGFILFYALYHRSCPLLLNRVENEQASVARRLESDVASLQTTLSHCETSLELTKAMAESQQSSQALISNAHSSLVAQHEQLLQQHAVTSQKLHELQLQTQNLETVMKERTEMVQALQEQVHACTSRYDQEQVAWLTKLENTQAQLAMAQSMLHEKMTCITTSTTTKSSSKQVSSTTTADDCPAQLLDLQLALRRRYTALLTETFGNPSGPSYLVEFTIQVPDALWAFPASTSNSSDDGSSGSDGEKKENIMHTTTLVVQLNHVVAYPVTTYTFLQLVQKGFYTGTQLFVPKSSSSSSSSTTTSTNDNNNDFILGGNAQYVAHKRIQANLTRRLAEYTGYHGTEPFLWLESAALVGNAAAAAAAAAAATTNDNDASSSSSLLPLLPPPPPCDPRGGFGFATRRAEFVILTSPRAAAQVAQHYNHDIISAKQQQEQQSQQESQQSQHEPSSSSSLYRHYLTCPGRVVHGLNIVQQIIQATIALQQEQQQQQQQQQHFTIPAATITSARIVSHKFENTQQQQPDNDDEADSSSGMHSEL